jgi:quaternary ammonium compound-resistance protein SugE
MAWFWLLLAGILEVCWTTSLKYTDGFSRPVPILFAAVFSVASLVFLGLALKTLPMGTAYAIWTGIGTIGAALLGIFLFSEPATAMRLASIGVILAGIIALRVAS